VKAAVDNDGSIKYFEALIVQEYIDHGYIGFTISMPPEQTPSSFFTGVQKGMRVLAGYTFFGGGLMITKEPQNAHIIAITSLHRGRKATVLDTNPRRPNRMMFNPFLRKVPLSALDRRVNPNGKDEPMATVFVYQSADDYRKRGGYIMYFYERYSEMTRLQADAALRQAELSRDEDAFEMQTAWQEFGMTKSRARRYKRLFDTLSDETS
jgi:hypothetical protein